MRYIRVNMPSMNAGSIGLLDIASANLRDGVKDTAYTITATDSHGITAARSFTLVVSAASTEHSYVFIA